jgi:hypothetical protein
MDLKVIWRDGVDEIKPNQNEVQWRALMNTERPLASLEKLSHGCFKYIYIYNIYIHTYIQHTLEFCILFSM